MLKQGVKQKNTLIKLATILDRAKDLKVLDKYENKGVQPQRVQIENTNAPLSERVYEDETRQRINKQQNATFPTKLSWKRGDDHIPQTRYNFRSHKPTNSKHTATEVLVEQR